jgi:hypothetical protein
VIGIILQHVFGKHKKHRLGKIKYFITTCVYIILIMKVQECVCSTFNVYEFITCVRVRVSVVNPRYDAWNKLILDFSIIRTLTGERFIDINYGCCATTIPRPVSKHY